MIRVPFLLALLLAGDIALAEPARSLSSIGQLPGEKVSSQLAVKDRNPFTRRDEKPEKVAEDKKSEETQIRALFGAMTVTGRVRGNGSDKILLGGLILELGELLPPLLDKQTERLAVAAITDKQVEIQFIETAPTAEPRRIFIPIDLHPHVTSARPPLPTVTAAPDTGNGHPSE